MNIWCIGDINYFVAVLNALAMLSNSGLFNDLIKLGLILAVMVIGFQALFQSGMGQGIPWGRFIVAFIIFKFLFGTVTTVIVNDTYTLKAQTVDNVPYGVAAAGSIMSQVSHEITLSLEQAFSLPNMTDTGFGGTLQTLLMKGDQYGAGLSTLNGGSITKTIVEYCDKCTSTGINLGALDPNAILVAADPWGAMKYSSEIYYATTWLPTDPTTGTLQSCSAAWGAIDNYLKGQLWVDWNSFLSAQICPSGVGTCDPVSTVQSALDSLATSGQDARNYMLAAVILPNFAQGQMNFNFSMGKPELSGVIEMEAQQQRNLQWQAEGSLFMNIARPMMAFFEGFLYAITPFMALLVAFVPSGLSLVGKYFMMFVWVQLWMPILAILNLYIQMVAQNKLAALIAGSIPLTSLQGNIIGYSTLSDWMSTAQVLVASTPAISLALLFGGAYTMVNLAGRLQHGEHIGESVKLGAPDVMQTAPLMNQTASYEQRGLTYDGINKTGAMEMAGTINMADTGQSMVSSAQQLSQSTGVSFQEALRETMSSGHSGSSGVSSGVTTRDGRSSTMSAGDSFSQAYSEKIAHATGLNTAQTQQLQGLISADMGSRGGVSTGASTGGAGALLGGLKFGTDGKLDAGVRSQLSTRFGDEMGTKIAQQMEGDAAASGKHNLQAVMQDTVTRDAASGRTAEYLNKYDQGKVQNLQKEAQRHYAAEEKYSEAAQMTRSLGGSAKIYTAQAAKIWQEQHGSGLQYANSLGIPGVHGDNEELHKEIQRAGAIYGVNPATAEWIGLKERLDHMAQKGDTNAFQALGKLRKEAFGAQGVDMGDPHQNKTIVPAGMQAEGDRVEGKAHTLTPPDNVEGHLQGVHGQASGPMLSKDDIDRIHFGRTNSVIDKSERGLKQKMLGSHDQAVKDQENLMGPLKNTAQGMTQMATSALQTVGQYGRVAGGEVSAGYHSFTSMLKNLTDPNYKGDPGKAVETLKANREAYGSSLVTEGKAHGLSDEGANLYASYRGQAFAHAIKSKFGQDIGVPETEEEQIPGMQLNPCC